MNGASVSPRLATLDDVDAIIATVATAFATDPAWAFIIGPDDRARQAFVPALLIPRIHRATAWVLDDCSAVAMWDRMASDEPIDAPADDKQDTWWAAFRAEVGEEIWDRLQAYDSALEAVGPSRPRRYLGVLATHPADQGCGRATAVLEPGLAAAHTDGWDCWLETSNPTNKSIYAGRGFIDATAGRYSRWATDLVTAPTSAMLSITQCRTEDESCHQFW